MLMNHLRCILGAWINRFFWSNSLCVEIEAAIQAFDIAKDLRMAEGKFEGDTLSMILALHGLNQFADW